MATLTMTQKNQKVTVSGTDEHDINFDAMLIPGDTYGLALIKIVSGTAVQFNCNGVTIDSDSISLTAADKEYFEIKKGVKLKYKGGAGSEVFNISIISQ